MLRLVVEVAGGGPDVCVSGIGKRLRTERISRSEVMTSAGWLRGGRGYGSAGTGSAVVAWSRSSTSS